MKVLGGLFLLSVLALASAFPSPPKRQDGTDGELKLSKKKLTKRQDEEMYFDPEDIGRYSIFSMLVMPGMSDDLEENETLWDCLYCCKTNATKDRLPLDTIKESKQDGVPAHNMNVLPGLKTNITDSFIKNYNTTIDRCLGCCTNGTFNETKETGKVRKNGENEEPNIQTMRLRTP